MTLQYDMKNMSSNTTILFDIAVPIARSFELRSNWILKINLLCLRNMSMQNKDAKPQPIPTRKRNKKNPKDAIHEGNFQI